MMLTVLSFIGVLLVVVLVHEVGHFVTAKIFKVRVEEFGIGFPPRLFSFKRGEVRYSINALPIGGFVKLAGEEDPNVSGSLAGKHPGVRTLVLAAGCLMNALLPLLLFTIAFMVPHDIVSGQVQVSEVADGSPAALAGVEVGDTILKIDGELVHNNVDLHRAIRSELGNEVVLFVQHRDGITEEISAMARWRPPAEEGAIGVSISTADTVLVRQSYPFWRAIPMAVTECIDTYILFKNEIISMIIGSAPADIIGPVGIFVLTGEVAKAGFSSLLEFTALFSINLAIINLFPLPALDGGRIVFILLEWIRRGSRVVSPKAEGMIHLIGFFLLLGSMMAIIGWDIIRISSGGGLLP
ncbi:RIP metalloprotease [Chloroflexota bacterium]